MRKCNTCSIRSAKTDAAVWLFPLWRALVEADIGRYKRVIGDALRSRTKGRQMTEVAIAVASLNRMLELGRPEYVRLP
jgi:hypothetical protein